MDSRTLFWLIFAIAMAVLEGVTVQLVSVWFAVGGLAACITSLFTDSLIIEVIVFVVVSATALAVTRPLVKKLKQRGSQPTNADRFVGKTGVVITAVDNSIPQGMVKVDNEKWTARSVSGEPIEEGATVTVTAIEGVKLMVEPKK